MPTTDLNCNSTDDNLERRLLVLRDATRTDYMVALIVVCMSLALIPPVIFLLPFIFIAHRILWNKSIPDDVIEKIRAIAPFPRDTHFRESRAATCSVFRAPLITILSVPPRFFERLESEEFRQTILHEYGHTKQYDLAVLAWLLGSSFLWVIVLIGDIPAIIAGAFGPYLERENSHLLHGTGLFWSLSLLLITVTCIATSVSILHRREYLADALGAERDHTAIRSMLVRHERRSLYYKREDLMTKALNFVTHPTDSNRLRCLANDEKPTRRDAFVSASIVSFLASYAAYLLEVSSDEGRWAWLDPAVMFLLFFGAFVYATKKIAIFATSQHSNFLVAMAAVCGFAAGMLSSLGSIFTLEIVVLGAGASPLQYFALVAIGMVLGFTAFSISVASYARFRWPRYFVMQLIECAGYLFVAIAMLVSPMQIDPVTGDIELRAVPWQWFLALEMVLIVVLVLFAGLVLFANLVAAAGIRLTKKLAVRGDRQFET